MEGGEDLRDMGRSLLVLPRPCTQHSSRPQCATHKLCHPEELVLLGHSLGITQAPLSSCSSQALQLVSVWRGGGRVRGRDGALRGAWQAVPLTLLLCPPGGLPETTPQWPLPVPGPPAGPGRDLPRASIHPGHAATGHHRPCHQHLAAGEPHWERQVLGA